MRLKLDLLIAVKSVVVLFTVWLGIAVGFEEVNADEEKTAKSGDY